MTYVTAAQATSERTVKVTFSGNVRATGTTVGGDALNPASWSMTRGDTSAVLIVLAVREVTAATVFELYTLQKFPEYAIGLNVSAAEVYDAADVIMGAPNYGDFRGMLAAATIVSRRTDVVDLQNHQTSPTNINGVLRVASTGDYAEQFGVEVLKKLILRRLTTKPGAFANLPSSYGLGIKEKEPLPIASLVELKVAVDKQVEQEPEVDVCNSRVSLDRSGVLTIQMSVLLKNGQQVTYPIVVPTASTF